MNVDYNTTAYARILPTTGSDSVVPAAASARNAGFAANFATAMRLLNFQGVVETQ